MFPLSFSDSVVQWWGTTSQSAILAQQRVLSFLPFYPNSDGVRIATASLVALSGKQRSINEFQIVRKDVKQTSALVMLHGYGAGLGMYYRNFGPLSEMLPKYKIFALDLLGMGLSSRPRFHISSRLSPEAKVDATEEFFLDALEEWREKRGIESMTLMGHSLGGYLSVAYTLKYPSRVDKLILVSPVGFPHSPYSVKKDEIEDAPEGESVPTRLSAEFTQDSQKSPPPPARKLPTWATLLWERNFSPFMFVRIPMLGPKFASSWTTRRFRDLPAEEYEAMHNYAYEVFRQKGSGEFALGYLLMPGAYARRPLVERMTLLAKAMKSEQRQDGKPKSVSFVYGSLDWMDSDSGKNASKQLQIGEIRSKVFIVDKAGHNVFLDNSELFNNTISEIIQEGE